MITDWLQHIEFAYPWVLGLLILLPVMIFEYIRGNRRRQASMLVTTTHFIQGARDLKTATLHLPFMLRCLAVAALVVAMALPRLKYTEQLTEGEGIDIVLCFDISGSMLAKDFQPNRLEAAKTVAQRFVQQRPGDRIGIVIFSSASFTLCPITPDHNAVLAQINNIESGYLQEEGTAIGSGLAASVDRLRKSKSKSKVVILLTDGVDVGGSVPPDLAKQMAKQYNVKVYTIGIGSDKEINEETDSPVLGHVTQTRKLEFNEDLLKDIAQTTGGQYFQATDNEALQKIYASINQLEKSKIQVTTYDHYTNKFLPFLIAGIILLLLEMILRYTFFKKFP
ncbi:VWA domain-containing protein [Panacibacter ginsenosidivorans]|uniref:VWA domain-containing protein n=1 Tax=Panacibacter ginsenosidivorans TaxID=1813871 RepID=A0A5B8VBG0_9BACT|nr:VWA domain-containing protein [Panacibacter ginsenosidivorans]QEC68784.1 VWA domain-containing protein [Panacibacter ginsenosidivorans]